MTKIRDHGGGLDAAMALYGGDRSDWLDLSTGINPTPFPVGDIGPEAWTALPDQAATERLEAAAREFWAVPDCAEIVLSPGASALIARMPAALGRGSVFIKSPTYNEHEAAFTTDENWRVAASPEDANTHIYVHPNNPTGELFERHLIGVSAHTIVDESFCDISSEQSHVSLADTEGVVVLKSFGKFWGLAGLRLGFAICAPKTAARLRDLLGPWPVSGIALEIGARALEDHAWASETRDRLADDANRLDLGMGKTGAQLVGGTSLFRLYDVGDAEAVQVALAEQHIWSRVFPYSTSWLRLGLPARGRWGQLDAALARIGQ